MDRNWFPKNYKTFKDPVHGDIVIEDEFIRIIDTPEFQRLHRIRQLSVADLVFSSADHTRFAHSIGTFHIMKKLIRQIEAQFHSMGLQIDKRHEHIALSAALLHDVGHGPFSHAFENLFSASQKSHEEWTTDIIKSRKTAVNRALRELGGDRLPEEVASLISKNQVRLPKGESNVFFEVLSSLISSQVDADRLDYLLRDSHNTGVKFGNIDVDRIISSINITVHNGRYAVYVPEKFLSDIEEYLISRYQMNKSVYYHPAKVEFEEVIKLIFTRVMELESSGALKHMPPYINLAKTGTLDVQSYCNLDEAQVVMDFKHWADEKDQILSKLCKVYLHREKYRKLRILGGEQTNIDKFLDELKNVIAKGRGEAHTTRLQYSWIQKNFKFSMYKSSKENILVLNKAGKLQDLTEVSSVFGHREGSVVNEFSSCFTYLCTDLIEIENGKLSVGTDEEIERLISSYDSRNHIEIENKYLLGQLSFGELDEYLAKTFGDQYSRGAEKIQVDTYYDNLARDFFRSGETIRVRDTGGKFVFTIKTPVSSPHGDIIDSQNERFEYEKNVESNSIESCVELIKEKSRLGIDIGNEFIAPLLKISNKRVKNSLSYGKANLEIAFDTFSYISAADGRTVYTEKQVEIELKSDYSKKILLDKFCRELETAFVGLEKTVESKLSIGLKILDKK